MEDEGEAGVVTRTGGVEGGVMRVGLAGGACRTGEGVRESCDGCLLLDKVVTSVSKYELCKY